jgi:hypothetical protein
MVISRRTSIHAHKQLPSPTRAQPTRWTYLHSIFNYPHPHCQLRLVLSKIWYWYDFWHIILCGYHITPQGSISYPYYIIFICINTYHNILLIY